MNVIEWVGIIASILIICSMSFKTTSVKGSICMRILNIIGSIVFVVYGALLPALSTAILNGFLVLLNTYHLVMLIVKDNRNKKDTNKIVDSEE